VFGSPPGPPTLQAPNYVKSEKRDEILHPFVIEEPAAPAELVVSDLAGELQQAIAAEAVRFQDLLGCAGHSSGSIGGAACLFVATSPPTHPPCPAPART
jgi:hypothetical protein